MKHHKPSFKNWLKYTVHAKLSLLFFVLVFAGVGVVVLRQSFASGNYRVIAYDPVTTQEINGGQFLHFYRELPSGSWQQWSAGPNTTPSSGGTSSNWEFKVRLVSPPPGYTFIQWSPGTPGNIESSPFTGTLGQAQVVSMRVVRQPTVEIKANGQAGSINVARGAALTLRWTTTHNPNSCAATGSWSGGKGGFGGGGQEDRTADTATAGIRTYTITCSSAGVSSPPSSVTVNVTAPNNPVTPVDPVTPTNPVTPRNPRPGNPVTAPGSDTEPPSVPSDFLAVADEEQGVVRLSWTPSTDNTGVTHYQLERSIDQVAWEGLADALPYAEYIDTTAQFTTKYFYRVRAFDVKGNASGYAGTEVTTTAFKVNVTVKDGGEITSEDGLVIVKFPPGAVTEDAQCSVSESEEVVSTEKGFSVVSGPFKVVCKMASNNIVTVFEQPLQVSVSTTSDTRKAFSAISIVALTSDNWETLASQNDGEKDSFELAASNNFAVVGKTKSTPLFIKVLLILLLLVGVGGAVIGILYVRYRRQQQAQYDDYMRQQSGLWK